MADPRTAPQSLECLQTSSRNADGCRSRASPSLPNRLSMDPPSGRRPPPAVVPSFVGRGVVECAGSLKVPNLERDRGRPLLGRPCRQGFSIMPKPRSLLEYPGDAPPPEMRLPAYSGDSGLPWGRGRELGRRRTGGGKGSAAPTPPSRYRTCSRSTQTWAAARSAGFEGPA